ncbi:unnamed protein product [Rotaria sp. Silwood1]|nr:unnamed protein product [Rotaria sp. Silwood1]
MKTDSLLTSSSKLSYQQLNSILNKSMTVSLSNVSSFSTRQMTLKKTCSCSTCTCSNNSMTYQNMIQSHSEDKILFWNETHHLPSNQNMNQASTEHKDSCSRDKHIVVVPIRSSHCQTETSKSDLQTINIDLKQSEKTINLHEPLNDILCRRLHKPLMFINRDVFCRHNRTLFYSTVPSADRNKELSTINAANLFSAKNKFSLSNTKNESTFLHDLTDIQSDKTLFLNNSQPFVINLHQGKQSNKKFKRNRRIINDHSIPLALATSLHSNLRLYDEDYFLTKYIHPLFTEKHYVR